MRIDDKLQKIEVLLSDVDGVLSDGTLVFDNQGIEAKGFHIRDGLGIRLWQRVGYQFGLITGRGSHIVKLRAAELGIPIIRQTADNKLPIVKDVAKQLGVELAQIAYIGDDLPDLAVVRAVGLGVAVADAAVEVRQAADVVTTLPGGRGAVREIIEMILKAQRRWDDLVQKFS